VGRPAREVSTILDVAQAAGVSPATVSRALRGLPRVSAETRARVQQVAGELSYVASPDAASLASGRTAVVGVVVPFLDRWYFSSLLIGAELQLRQSGFAVLLCHVGNVGLTRFSLLDLLPPLEKRVDALLVLSLKLEPGEVALLHRLDLPVVTVGVPAEGWPCVRIDDVAVASTATSHLIELGHRDIAYLGGDPRQDVHVATPSDRLDGFRSTMAAHGLVVRDEWVLTCDWTVTGGITAGARLLCGADRPTAVFAASDEMAMGVLHSAARLGLRVPQDLSVIGIDDHEMAFLHDLTTIAQPVQTQGQLAGKLLLEALAVAAAPTPSGAPSPDPWPAGPGPQVVTAPTSLVPRGTTGAPSRRPNSLPGLRFADQ